MEEKTAILTQIEKEKKVEVSEKKYVEQDVSQEKIEQSKQEKKTNSKRYFNAFSSSSYNTEKVENVEKQKAEKKTSSIIEKPNYDFIEPLSEQEQQKVYKIEHNIKQEKKVYTFGKRMRTVLFSVVLLVCGIWGISNVVNINSVKAEYDALSNVYYNINLPNYLKNLTQLDAVNKDNMENLFPTIPEESTKPTSIEKKTNWFDRVCEFLAGLFGG